MRVAFFGGTFDPIHRGHLALAAAAARTYALDRVLFTPTAMQPLRPPAIASFVDRLAMVTLACASLEGAGTQYVACGLDAPRTDAQPNYTVDTLAALSREYPDATLFALAGADSFLTLRQWREPDRLLALAEWIVVSRPGSPLSESQLAPLGLSAAQRAGVHLLTTVHENVSATELRLRLRAGDAACAALLPPRVATYIHTHDLYR